MQPRAPNKMRFPVFAATALTVASMHARMHAQDSSPHGMQQTAPQSQSAAQTLSPSQSFELPHPLQSPQPESRTQRLVRYCFAQTPRNGVTYFDYTPSQVPAGDYRSCGVRFHGKDGAGMTLAAVVRASGGALDYRANMSYVDLSVEVDNRAAIFTDNGLDESLDYLAMSYADGTSRGMPVTDENRDGIQTTFLTLIGQAERFYFYQPQPEQPPYVIKEAERTTRSPFVVAQR